MYENHRNTIGKCWFYGIWWELPSGNQTRNHPWIEVLIGKPPMHGPCSIAMFDYRRLNMKRTDVVILQGNFSKEGTHVCCVQPKVGISKPPLGRDRSERAIVWRQQRRTSCQSSGFALTRVAKIWKRAFIGLGKVMPVLLNYSSIWINLVYKL